MKEFENMTPEAARAREEYLLNYGANMQKEIDGLARPEAFEAGGSLYISCNGSYKLLEPPRPPKVVPPDVFRSFSLDGLIDYIHSDVDGMFQDPAHRHIVRVTDPVHVEVLAPLEGYWKERLLVAECSAVVPKIRFGEYMDTESFQIMVQTSFADSSNRDMVLKLAGSVRKEQSMQTADDGTSQRVTINAGVATAADVIVKNPVTLTPFRTFREVEQPVSPFILRFNQEGEAALFTGDGSAWKLEAAALVGSYLKSNLAGYNVEVIA